MAIPILKGERGARVDPFSMNYPILRLYHVRNTVCKRMKQFYGSANHSPALERNHPGGGLTTQAMENALAVDNLLSKERGSPQWWIRHYKHNFQLPASGVNPLAFNANIARIPALRFLSYVHYASFEEILWPILSS